jgi:hypothetical protein
MSRFRPLHVVVTALALFVVSALAAAARDTNHRVRSLSATMVSRGLQSVGRLGGSVQAAATCGNYADIEVGRSLHVTVVSTPAQHVHHSLARASSVSEVGSWRSP